MTSDIALDTKIEILMEQVRILTETTHAILYIVRRQHPEIVMPTRWELCCECDGTGKDPGGRLYRWCDACAGTGQVPSDTQTSITDDVAERKI